MVTTAENLTALHYPSHEWKPYLDNLEKFARQHRSTFREALTRHPDILASDILTMTATKHYWGMNSRPHPSEKPLIQGPLALVKPFRFVLMVERGVQQFIDQAPPAHLDDRLQQEIFPDAITSLWDMSEYVRIVSGRSPYIIVTPQLWMLTSSEARESRK